VLDAKAQYVSKNKAQQKENEQGLMLVAVVSESKPAASVI
jgi:hypothetical protein